jgi:polyisoprenoid-binding protein YceI
MACRLQLISASLFIFLFSASVQGKSTRFDMKDLMQRDLVQITSDTPLEKISGLNNAIAGWVEVDPNDLAAGIKGEWEIDVRLFETGDSQKNESLREKILTASEFPSATLSLTRFVSASKAKLKDQDPVTVKVDANLTIRGVTRLQNLLLRLTFLKQNDKTAQRLNGNLLRLSSSFDVDLSKFEVKIPEGLKFIAAPVLQVGLDIVGTDGVIAPIIPSNEPLKKKAS